MLSDHMSGYKMRTSIWKALKARGKAIRSALSKYNSLAAQMVPPAPTLEWKDVVNYTFISEFDLLHHSRTQTDVTNKPWTVPYNREVAVKYWKIRGAFDEIKRLNVEARRLYTHIALQRAEFKAAIEASSKTDRSLAAELQARYNQFERLDRVHLHRLRTMSQLRGFTGQLEIGVPAEPRAACILKGTFGDLRNENQDDQDVTAPDEDDGDQDDEDDVMVRMTDFLEDLAIGG